MFLIQPFFSDQVNFFVSLAIIIAGILHIWTNNRRFGHLSAWKFPHGRFYIEYFVWLRFTQDISRQTIFT